MKLLFTLLLLSFICFCYATEFGSAKSGKIDLLEKVREARDSLNSRDFERYASYYAKDGIHVDPTGTQKGRENIVKQVKGILDAMDPFHYNLLYSAKTGPNKVSAVLQFNGKFVNDMGPLKATNNIVSVRLSVVNTFNEEGLATKTEAFYDFADFQEQLSGKKLTPREQAIRTYLDGFDGKIDMSFVRSVFADDFEYVRPAFGINNADEEVKFMKTWRAAAPDIHFTHADYFPSAEDENVWISTWRVEGTVSAPNPLGMPIGTKLNLPGVSSVRFNSDNKMTRCEAFIDPIDLAKQMGQL